MHGTLKPLHCACMVADADCVELLLEKGAEVCYSCTRKFFIFTLDLFGTFKGFGLKAGKYACKHSQCKCEQDKG